MTFALFAHTPGDDLLPSSKTIVATSKSLEPLEVEKNRRAEERKQWFEKYGSQVPEWAYAGLISEETIECVPELIP
jgi:hypothetical protein